MGSVDRDLDGIRPLLGDLDSREVHWGRELNRLSDIEIRRHVGLEADLDMRHFSVLAHDPDIYFMRATQLHSVELKDESQMNSHLRRILVSPQSSDTAGVNEDQPLSNTGVVT